MLASGRGSIKMFGKEKLIQEKNNLEADLDKLSFTCTRDSRFSIGGLNGMT